ncbi:amino acid permease [Nocardioides sp. MAH-18]|uniref:Amino acid permease n=1 Tax=Nocardioides agri TaxID=2682843 RepID=A0A6L6XRI1_9ACTN|nr:amino acid permease [Nocardioides sp. CGMCC 1.13656]MBA2954753.1 amino acid permease [Nocardioides sp. CGMCC 1.13656]MVQ49608.1 amino acid permease [Nocardioides sp. MAH-18]
MPPTLTAQLTRRKPLRLQAGPHGGPDLSRSLSTFQLMMFGVGATVGTGIFFVLQEAVPDAGPAVIVSFLIAGLGAGLSALCYAEIASAIPVSGSTYSYAYHAFGELVAMGIAACVLLEYGVSSGAVAVGWSGYLNELLENVLGWHLPDALSYSPIPYEDNVTGIVNLPAVLLVMMCTILLVRGASESARVNTVMVIIKLSVLLMFVAIALTAWDSDNFAGFWDAGPHGISAAAATIFFSFIGLDAVSTAGEEVRDPQRALPRAIMGALAVVVTVYVLVAVAGIAAQPPEKFSDPDQQSAGLSVILEDITGSTVAPTILAAGAVISIFSVTLVTLYGQTRILFAMGRDGMLPDRFSSVNPRTLTPTFNTIVCGTVVALIGGFVPADYLWDTVSIGTLVAFIVVAAGVLALRRTQPDLPRPFRVPLHPVVPVLTIAVCLYILSGIALVTWVIFGCWLALVLGFYMLWGRRHAVLGKEAAR